MNCVHKVVEIPFGETSCELNKPACSTCGVNFRLCKLKITEEFKISIWYTVLEGTVTIRSHEENPDYEVSFRLLGSKLHKSHEFKQPWALWPSPKVRSKMYGFAGAILNKKNKPSVFQEAIDGQLKLDLSL